VSDERVSVSFTVNGAPYDLQLPARRLLSDALRHDLRLTGTHVGCEHGVCGACTVLVDGAAMRSCLLFAVSLDGAAITTVEGCRSADGGMGPVQQAFHDCHALQCGFCTPGFITTITAYLRDHPAPTREEAREAISGNLCRCTGYVNIVSAVQRAAELLARGEASTERTARSAAPSGASADVSSGAPRAADGRTAGAGATVDGPGGRPSGARPDGSGAPASVVRTGAAPEAEAGAEAGAAAGAAGEVS
jgi:aerobic carbon-monoxide dehydrogenase small subunit